MIQLFWLLVGHAVADYPLQGEFLALAKNHKKPLPGFAWWIALSMHCLIHAGAVALITGNLGIGLCEFVVHFVIDYLKSEGTTNFKTDQLLHVLCKVVYAVAPYLAGTR